MGPVVSLLLIWPQQSSTKLDVLTLSFYSTFADVLKFYTASVHGSKRDSDLCSNTFSFVCLLNQGFLIFYFIRLTLRNGPINTTHHYVLSNCVCGEGKEEVHTRS